MLGIATPFGASRPHVAPCRSLLGLSLEGPTAPEFRLRSWCVRTARRAAARTRLAATHERSLSVDDVELAEDAVRFVVGAGSKV